jgi:hypothetical protein
MRLWTPPLLGAFAIGDASPPLHARAEQVPIDTTQTTPIHHGAPGRAFFTMTQTFPFKALWPRGSTLHFTASAVRYAAIGTALFA